MAFDPIPTSDVQVFVDVRGRTYKAITVKELSAGALNEVMSSAAGVVGEIFASSATFKRVREVYDSENDEDTTIELDTLSSDVVPPPLPFHVREIDGSSILSQDLKMIVPAEVFEVEDAAAYVFQLRS